ncbi:NUDIX domain-containing protein [Patescibacteria group bacterium]|nr:NUDIX domain-containing protein [Patescibacteria group bacterium]MBU1074524.1 NUDIX domain-containing protein [Patescibacteria group bacterium]MBU1951610.1 NUDIX domain-containing protein [Patescibacteria group bacterium]
MDIKLFTATKAFIKYKGKILILRESGDYQDGTNEGSFDVPGGRVEPGQRFDESLRREIKEETGLNVAIGDPFFVNEWHPQKNGEQWQIIGIFFECEADTDQVALSEDHNKFEWIDPEQYKDYKLIDNLHPAFESYISRLSE